jgi:hypothetical protein
MAPSVLTQINRHGIEAETKDHPSQDKDRTTNHHQSSVAP